MERRKCPVFVIGCHRSGTNLLYDTLMSAGGFAIYRGYLPVYKLLIPRVGRLDKLENRKKLLQIWLRSKGFRRSGLDAGELSVRVERECRNGGDFIRITMDEIARVQGAFRWAVYDPDNVHHVPKIKAEIPEALFVHLVRDGRDIALSLRKMGGFRPLPWDRASRSLQSTAIYWEWIVRTGRRYGRVISSDYIEVHYEELVTQPRAVLKQIGQFLDHDLDYENIRAANLGRLRESNSSFRGEEPELRQQNPVGRWKKKLSPEEVASLEAVVGTCLEDLGYELVTTAENRKVGIEEIWMRMVYLIYLNSKLWLKTRTQAGRLASLAELELTDALPQAASVHREISMP